MKTPEQLKGTIRYMAKTKNLSAQEVLQMFFFERVLERLANSDFKSNFILKGGMLISSMIGISERTTMDMDTTVIGIKMEENEIVHVFKKILSVDVNDDVIFEYKRITPIREDDAYSNFRLHFNVKYGKVNNTMTIDVTTGDPITPAAIIYDYPMMFDERKIPVMAYSIETVLAEKFETIIHRNIETTRARDFYDIYALIKKHKPKIRMDIVKVAIMHTARKRDSVDDILEWRSLLGEIKEEPNLFRLWKNYISENRYIGNLSFEDVLEVIEKFGNELDIKP